MDHIPQDNFKRFGEGFEGFPKQLPEDVVEYMIFVIDSQLSDVQTRERLQAFQRALATLEKKFLKEYIWQRDSMKLDLTREEGRWLLKGSTNYGDSVADEWLIVWLLRELSKEFPDAWMRIYDTDGEFLLIEAANALPNWLNPEMAENRVWINNHRLLVVPLSKQEEPKPLKAEEALAILKDTPARPQHYPKIDEEAFHRLKNYPTAIAENQHHATLPLPRRVAHVLHTNPAYIAPVVEAFYLRDPIALRLLQPEKSKTPLKLAPKDFVEVSVRFTKVLYAQLLGQKWVPPGIWGDALANIMRKGDKQTSMTQEKAEIGIKVAAGMEMLAQHKVYANKKASREIQLLLDDLESGDDTLPTDAEIAAWPKRDDDEEWLNIDFDEFERELSGKGGPTGPSSGFGDKNAQENLRKMVDRFNKFLEDDEAGLDGAKGLGLDPMDVDNDSDRGWDDPEDSDEEEEEDSDQFADAEFEEYEKAMEKFMALSSAEKSALVDDARELARAEEEEREEDEEIQKLSEAMEAELFGLGALKLDPAKESKKEGKKAIKSVNVDKGKGKVRAEEVADDDDDDDDDEGELLDEDYNLVENMLEAFKGQGGMAGPAGNMLRAMGIQMPPDADDDLKTKGEKA